MILSNMTKLKEDRFEAIYYALRHDSKKSECKVSNKWNGIKFQSSFSILHFLVLAHEIFRNNTHFHLLNITIERYTFDSLRSFILGLGMGCLPFGL